MLKRTAVLVVALLLAGVAAYSIWQFLEGVEEDARAELALVQVFRATETIPAGTEGALVVSQGLFIASEESQKFLPGNPPTSTEAFLDETSLRAYLEGKVAAGPIAQNEILTAGQWMVPEQTAEAPSKLSKIIEEGKQAITIQVDEVRGVGGFVRPGDKVNAIVTITAPVVDDVFGATEVTDESIRRAIERIQEAGDTTQSRFVLQGLEVIAVGGQARTGNEASDNVLGRPAEEGGEPVAVNTNLLTLEVSPDDAERLVFAFEQGSVWLTLVPGDADPVRTGGVNRATLFD